METRSRLLLLAALGVGVFLVGAELLITAVALPAILGDLADWTQLRRASWIVNGYLLAYIATMPLAGRAADRFGLPPLFALSLFVFALGSALAGTAQTLDQLVAARIVQGIGGGGLVPLATAGASHLFGGEARARALGLIGALTFLGMAAGPFAGAAILDLLDLGPNLTASGGGGILTQLFSPAWRWIFYLGVPLALLAAIYTWAAAPAWPRRAAGGSLDLPGAALFTLALAGGLLSLTLAGAEERLLGLGSVELALGTAVALALALARFLTAREPFLDIRYFGERIFGSAVLLSLLTGYALATAIVGGAVFVDRVRYGGPDEQRLVLGALAGAMAVGALVSGFALRRLGAVLLSIVGLLLGTAGLVVLARSEPGTAIGILTAGLALFGLGFGLTVTPRSAVAVEALGARAFGLASAGVTVARMIGMAVGVAVLTALGSNRIEALSVVLTDAAARDAVLPPGLRGRPLEDGLVVDALEHWASAQAATILAGLFAIAALVLAAAVLPALLMGSGRAPSGERRRRDPRAGAGDGEREAALAL